MTASGHVAGRVQLLGSSCMKVQLQPTRSQAVDAIYHHCSFRLQKNPSFALLVWALDLVKAASVIGFFQIHLPLRAMNQQAVKDCDGKSLKVHLQS